ncbi:hypothetical protein [Emticicia sp. TH156]|uniref:hypothetical protein n=1 Tax=Emticicia sp. TH156 TaxID=2067454 RepID=UPI001C2003F5|nr:hypothetical protein [Emticicia sp. TH156]
MWTYIVHNNPDFQFKLQENQSVSSYLEEKVSGIGPLINQLLMDSNPSYVIEEQCLSELTNDLRPSRYIYIRSVLEEDFQTEYTRLLQTGILTFEINNMVEACKELLDELEFSEENEDNRHIRYAVIGQIHGYLN